jgi:hypothetical protein
MKPISTTLLKRTFTFTVVLALCSAARLASGAGSISWSGADAISLVNSNWSDVNNWTGLAIPGAGNPVLFNNNGVTTGASGADNADNVVNQNFTVTSLWYTQTNPVVWTSAATAIWHNTLINPGVTLTLADNNTTIMLEDGTQSDPPNGQTYVYSSISGPGALVVNNTNVGSAICIQQGSGTYAGDSDQWAAMDISGLNTFQATVGRLMLGVEGVGATPGQVNLFNNARTTGFLFLAATNNITLAQTGSVATDTGHAATNGSALMISDTYGSFSDFQCILCLGLDNTINADTITIGRVQSYHTSVLTFNTSAYVPAMPYTLPQPNQAYTGSTLKLRGTSATRVSQFFVADDTAGAGNAACCIGKATSPDQMIQPPYDTTVPIGCAGMVDLSGGTSDIMIDSLTVAKGFAGAGGGKVLGVFNMGAGTMNVNTVQLGVLSSASATVPVTGWLNITSGSVLVNSNDVALGVGIAAIATGNLNITNGSLSVGNGYGIVDNGESISEVTLVNSAVSCAYIGSPTAPIGSLTIGDSTLNLAVDSLSAPVVTARETNVSSSSGIVINITSIANAPGLQKVITLISSANNIVYNNTFTGGTNGTDFILGTLPAGFAGYLQITPSSVQLVLTASTSVPDSWTGNGLSNTNWSDVNNWSSLVEPNASTPAYFYNTASVASSALSTPGGGPGAFLPAKINNSVDANVTTIGLIYDNTNGTYHNTLIANNNTLTLSTAGLGLTVGSSLQDFGNTTGNVTISGGAGTLNVNSALSVGLGNNTPGSTPKATLDMSDLGTFNASVPNFLVGVAYSVNQPAGVVYLAQTNTITASSPQPDTSDAASVGLEVGDTPTLAGNIGSALYLGQSNTINANAISIGRQLATGGIFFNPAVTNSNPSASSGPWAYFRGASGGASTMNTWTIGNGVVNAGTPNPVKASGTANFTGGYVNALVGTMTVANSSSGTTGNNPVTGTLTFGAGTINANTLNVSYNNAYSDGSVYSYGVGTVNVNGTAALVVNNTLNLAFAGGPLSGATPSATLNINGASASVAANAIVAGATSTINVTGGSLAATNGIDVLTSLNLTNATITVGATTAPFINAQNVSLGGAGNTINIQALQNVIEQYPATITVLQSATAIAGTYNINVTVPAGYTGGASESADHKAVLLTLTSGPIGSRGNVIWTANDFLALVSTNWSDATNWSPSALDLLSVPGPSDTAYFGNAGITTGGSGAAYADNIVDHNITVASVWYTQTNAIQFIPADPELTIWHNTLINPGVTLTAAGTNITIMLESGTQSDPPDGFTYCYNTISGGGTLVVNNTNVASAIVVQQGSSTYTGDQGLWATLDMSGLNTFQATVGRILLGLEGQGVQPGQVTLFDNHRSAAILNLAATNNITLTQLGNIQGGFYACEGGPALVVGDTPAFGDNPTILGLGLNNTINADTITVGRNGMLKSGVLQYNTAVWPSGSTLTLGGTSSGRVLEFIVADSTYNGNVNGPYDPPDPRILATVGTYPNISEGYGNEESGEVDLTAGTSDLMINTLVLGLGYATGSSGYIVGQFDMGAGTLNVNTLQLGVVQFTGAGKPVSGVLNVDNGTVVVNQQLALGVQANAATVPFAAGYLTINGGVVSAAGITASGNTNSTIVVNGGTLSLTSVAGSIGTAAAPVGSLTFSGTSTLNLADGSLAAPVVISNLVNSGTATINITTLPLIGSVPKTIPLIQSGNPIIGAPGFVLGSLPAGYTGTLGTNVSGTVIQLTINTAPFPPHGAKFTSVNLSAGNVVLAGTNGLANGIYYVLSSTNVALPFASWPVVATSSYDGSGHFNIAIPETNSPSFYIIKSQ